MTQFIALAFVMTAIVSFFAGAWFGVYALNKKINERLNK